MKLSLWQRLLLRVNGAVFLRYEKREGWKAYLPIYAVRCKKHGVFEQHPHGYDGHLPCSKCLDEIYSKIT